MPCSGAKLQCCFVQAIRTTLGCEELQQLLAEVEAVLDEDAQV